MASLTMKVIIEGTKPLLQNNSFEEGKKVKKGTVYVPEDEAAKRVVLDPDGKISIKSTWVEGALAKAAGDFKQKGKRSYRDAIRAEVEIPSEYIPLEASKYVIDSRPVVVSRARIMRCRPRFNTWRTAEFNIVIRNTETIDADTLQSILEDAGDRVGVGDFRPKFGLFKVVKFEAVR